MDDLYGVEGKFNKKALDEEEYVCAVIEASLAVLGTAAGGTGGKVLKNVRKMPGAFWKVKKTGDKLDGFKANPFFDLHGIESDETSATASYLRQRAIKGFGSAAFSAVGSAFSGSTGGVNVTSAAKAGSSLAQTSLHIIKLQAIAEKWPRSRPIQAWVRALMEFKNAKVVAKTADLAGSLNSILGVLATFATVAIKLNMKITQDHIAKRIAAEMHWRAYQETVVGGMLAKRLGGGGDGPAGPASEILYELFTQRGGSWLTSKIFGKYEVDRFIKEPVGWEAISDKLKLI